MESFVFYTHYAEKMKMLPPEKVANLLFAICDYVEHGTEPELDDTAADMCFSFIRTQLDKDIAKYENTCRKRAEAGRRGAAATNSKRQQEAAKAANADFGGAQNALQLASDPPKSETVPPVTGEKPMGEPQPKKSRKKKDGPEKVKYGEFVRMTEEEHQKLQDEYGPEMTARMIEVLDNYKGSKGKTYQSDYRAILSWVRDRVKEDFAKRGGGSYGGFNSDRGSAQKPAFTPSTGFKRAGTDGE